MSRATLGDHWQVSEHAHDGDNSGNTRNATAIFEWMITFITYYIELMVQISDVAKESMTKIFEETAESIKTGKGPKTYEEFYDFWKNTLSSVFDNLFYSDEFSKLLAETVNAGMDMKILRNKNVEAYLKEWPIPVKSDMDSLYKKFTTCKKTFGTCKKCWPIQKKPLQKMKASKLYR